MSDSRRPALFLYGALLFLRRAFFLFSRPCWRGHLLSDAAALLRTILANPGDDAPCLVFADWLDEHDKAEAAELIRRLIGELKQLRVMLSIAARRALQMQSSMAEIFSMPPDLAAQRILRTDRARLSVAALGRPMLEPPEAMTRRFFEELRIDLLKCVVRVGLSAECAPEFVARHIGSPVRDLILEQWRDQSILLDPSSWR